MHYDYVGKGSMKTPEDTRYYRLERKYRDLQIENSNLKKQMAGVSSSLADLIEEVAKNEKSYSNKVTLQKFAKECRETAQAWSSST